MRLDDLLKRAPRANAVVMTDTRGSWAEPWILSVSRAGIMEAYPNHTFQPNAVVSRGDLAQAASQGCRSSPPSNPQAAASLRNAAAGFPTCRRRPSELPGGVRRGRVRRHDRQLDGTFQLSRPVTGAEALPRSGQLEELVRAPGAMNS